jgi:hypothetical protein
LTSTATRTIAGTSSRNSSSRFAANSSAKKIDPCQIAAWSGEARNKTKLDRIITSEEYDRDRCGCRFGCQRRSMTSRRSNHGNSPANQIVRQLRQAIDLIVGPPVFDRYVLAFCVAGVLQTLAKCAQGPSERVKRLGV